MARARARARARDRARARARASLKNSRYTFLKGISIFFPLMLAVN